MSATAPTPDIAILVPVEFLPESFDDLDGASGRAGLVFAVERRPTEPMASSAIWLLPTACAVFLSGKFFGVIAEEAGRDVFREVKRMMSRLGSAKVTYVSSTPGKLPAGDRPGALSIAVELSEGLSLRFVFGGDSRSIADALTALIEQVQAERQAGGCGPLAKKLLEVEPRRRWSVIARFDANANRWHLWIPP